MCRTGPLVEVVDILRDDLHVEIAFQAGNGLVGGIGLCGKHLAATHVVEPDDRIAVVAEGFGCAYILDAVVGPEAVGIAECSYSAVGTYAGTGEYD